MYNLILNICLCRYPFQLLMFFCWIPQTFIKSRFHRIYYFFQKKKCSLENWVFTHFPRSEEMLQKHFKLKFNLDSFALPRNLTIYTRKFQGDADESNFWQCSLILKKTWLEDEPYYLIKLLSKNQVIDSIWKLKHLNYLYRKNRKRMPYK